MSQIVQFVKSIILLAFVLGAAGTLVEATGFMGKEAAKAHLHGGIKLKLLNQKLIGNKH